MEWVRFFLGTPRRFLATTGGIALLVAAWRPEILERAIDRLIGAVIAGISPLLGPALTVLIVFAGLRLIIFGRK